jgi:hypothetical protein
MDCLRNVPPRRHGRREAALEAQTVHRHIVEYTYFLDVVKQLHGLQVSPNDRNLP